MTAEQLQPLRPFIRQLLDQNIIFAYRWMEERLCLDVPDMPAVDEGAEATDQRRT